jgi:hypothetical protein
MYGCETWFLSLREEVKALRKILKPSRQRISGEWRE